MFLVRLWNHQNEKNVKTFYGNVNGEEIPLFMGIEVNSFKNDQYVDQSDDLNLKNILFVFKTIGQKA